MPPDADAAGVRSARPAISIDGQDRPEVALDLLALEIEESDDGLAACELEIVNWGARGSEPGFLWFGRDPVEFGKGLRVSLGDDALFEGAITGVEARFPEEDAPRIRILAEDRFQDLRMTRRTRSFADLADADVVRRIADDHGLTADVDLPGPTHRVLAQLNQSDLAFLRHRAGALDGEVVLDGKKIVARRRGGRGDPALVLYHGSELRELVVLADLAHQRTSLELTGWDVGGKTAVRERVTDSLVAADARPGQSGPAILQRALGQRSEVIAAGVPLSSDEARARAEAAFRERARRFVRGRGTCRPDARLRVGTWVTVKGLGPLFEGDYRIHESRHRFDSAQGLRTEIGIERLGLGGGT